MIETRQLAPVAAASAATTIWLAALGLLTTPYMLHQLGASAYAVFALITIVTAYLSNLELGFGQTTIRFLARARGAGDTVDEKRIVDTSLVIFIGAGALAGVVVFLAASPIVTSFADFPSSVEGDAVVALRLSSVLLLATFLSNFCSSALTALGSFALMVGSRALFGTLASASAVVAAGTTGDVRTVIAAQVGVAVAMCALLLWGVARATVAELRPRFHRSTFRAMRGFGLFVLGTGIAYQATLQGPPTILAGNVPSAELAAYAVPAIVMQQLILLVTSGSMGFQPFASAESVSNDRSRLVSVFRSNLRLTIAVTAPVAAFLAIFGKPLLTAWVGANFAADAVGPLRFLAVAASLVALSSPPADISRALGHAGWVFAFTVTAATGAMGATFLLVGSQGAAGAALGLAIGLAVAVFPFLFIVAARLLDQPPAVLLSALLKPIGAAAGFAGLCWLGATTIPGFVGALVSGIVFGGVYCIFLYRLVLEDLERQTLRAGGRRLAGLPASLTSLLRRSAGAARG